MSSAIMTQALQTTFQDLMEQFNRVVVAPARAEQGPGKYQWSLDTYTLEVVFPEKLADYLVPFRIFIGNTGPLALGAFDTHTLVVPGFQHPAMEHLRVLTTAMSMILTERSGSVPLDSTDLGPEPAMILTNMNDINDEWVEWYRRENPGTSYSKAVHAALTHMNSEVKKFKIIIEKYSIRT